MKEIITKIDYAEINYYKLNKTPYMVKKDPNNRNSFLIKMLKVTCEIGYSCYFENKFISRGSKEYLVYQGVEVSDEEWPNDIKQLMLTFRGMLKKDVAGWPEDN